MGFYNIIFSVVLINKTKKTKHKPVIKDELLSFCTFAIN